MTTHLLISNATDSPLPRAERSRRSLAVKPKRGEGLGVRSIPKRLIEVTMFAAGVETLEGLAIGKGGSVISRFTFSDL